MRIVSDEPDILLDQAFFPKHEELIAQLLAEVTWDESMRARKTAGFGLPYDYSQMSYAASDMPPCLDDVIGCLKARLSITFNNCLLNYYETGQNTMGFHADETNGLQPGTGVAIVSLGSERTITFRSIDQTCLVDYQLLPGSMLYMDDNVQQNWTHAIRKQKEASPRISLTWRAIRSD